ncbi:putative glycosyltransferase 6 domain-containing protein 1 [Echinops telfairi]|uniref:Glycosyltransferase 6 domain-containing protein 1 n=1 Tax=Echinops telfairi TaxID=9371 RepID=A0ABM0J4C4_ECHTE|nr:putative glycosyltransferase 6 domain-containing protein 1 [Echinops telfairi]
MALTGKVHMDREEGSVAQLRIRTRFLDKYLKRFLESADKHFMVGHKVIFYITVDDLFRLPDINFGPQRTFRIFKIDSEDKAWSHDLHLVRMQTLWSRIQSHVQKEVDFLFSMAVNQVFQGDFGAEALGRSVAQLHAWWYFRSTETPPYERRPGSAACIPSGEGDFYYSSSVMGGTPQELLQFASHYLQSAARDSSRRLRSTFERHLNKYFFLHKPSMLLSPEYGWDPRLRLPPQMKRVKVACLSERD